MKLPDKRKVLWGFILCCILTCIPACGGMSASDVEKKVLSDPDALKIHLIHHFLVPFEKVILNEVKVEAVYQTLDVIPARWRNPNINFNTLENLAQSKGNTIIYAIVKVRGTCIGMQRADNLQKSESFEGTVLYAVSKKIPPMPLLPQWQ